MWMEYILMVYLIKEKMQLATFIDQICTGFILWMRQKQRNSVNVLIAGDAFVDGIIDVLESIEIRRK